MATVTLQDHTIKSENLAAGYFRKSPVDVNYVDTEYRSFGNGKYCNFPSSYINNYIFLEPDTSIENTRDITFTLPALDGAFQYMVNVCQVILLLIYF